MLLLSLLLCPQLYGSGPAGAAQQPSAAAAGREALTGVVQPVTAQVCVFVNCLSSLSLCVGWQTQGMGPCLRGCAQLVLCVAAAHMNAGAAAGSGPPAQAAPQQPSAAAAAAAAGADEGSEVSSKQHPALCRQWLLQLRLVVVGGSCSEAVAGRRLGSVMSTWGLQGAVAGWEGTRLCCAALLAWLSTSVQTHGWHDTCNQTGAA